MYVQPVVGIPKNGRQIIAIEDKSGVVRQVVSTPEQVDEFLKQRQKYQTFNKYYILPSILGAGAGAATAVFSKMKSIPEIAGFALICSACGAFGNALLQMYRCNNADQKFI